MHIMGQQFNPLSARAAMAANKCPVLKAFARVLFGTKRMLLPAVYVDRTVLRADHSKVKYKFDIGSKQLIDSSGRFMFVAALYSGVLFRRAF